MIGKIFFLDRFCYFELNYLLKQVLFPSLFNMTLNVSRLVDVEPTAEFKLAIRDTQQRLTKCLLPLEILLNKRGSDEQYAIKLAEEASAAQKAVQDTPSAGNAVAPAEGEKEAEPAP